MEPKLAASSRVIRTPSSPAADSSAAKSSWPPAAARTRAAGIEARRTGGGAGGAARAGGRRPCWGVGNPEGCDRIARLLARGVTRGHERLASPRTPWRGRGQGAFEGVILEGERMGSKRWPSDGWAKRRPLDIAGLGSLTLRRLRLR